LIDRINPVESPIGGPLSGPDEIGFAFYTFKFFEEDQQTSVKFLL
jgi:hypothetical protein